MELERENKRLKVLIVILLVFLVAFGGYYFYINVIKGNDKNTPDDKEAINDIITSEDTDDVGNDNDVNETIDTFGINDTFSIDTKSGQVDVLGYVEIKEREPSEFDSSNNEKIEYIYFHIIDTKSNNFLSYIEELKGNNFVSEKAIGLGCRIDNLIKYYNSSNKNGFKYYNLSLEDSNEILASNINNPIKLRLNKLELFGGKDTSSCYSHITNIEIIKD